MTNAHKTNAHKTNAHKTYAHNTNGRRDICSQLFFIIFIYEEIPLHIPLHVT